MLISLAIRWPGSSGMESAGKIIIPNNQRSISDFIITSAVNRAPKLGKKTVVTSPNISHILP